MWSEGGGPAEVQGPLVPSQGALLVGCMTRPRRILFVIPPYFNAADYLGKERAAVLPTFTLPYGVLSLHAWVGRHCRVPPACALVDLNITLDGLVRQKFRGDCAEVLSGVLEREIRQFEPDIVGISALFSSAGQYLEPILRTCRRVAPRALTVAGGGLPSATFETILQQHPALDAVCKGEGELPLQALVDGEDPWQVLREHAAWITREGIAQGKVPRHDFVMDLDQVPPLDYGWLQLEFYNSRSLDKQQANLPKRELSIHTSRGCPFNCVFCANPSLHGHKVRRMSVDRVLSDVRRMKDDLGMTVLLVEDDHFFHDRDRARALLSGFAHMGVRIEFPNGVAVAAVDDEMAGLLSRAGVSAVALAVESGSDHVLRNIMHKPLRTSAIQPAVDALRRHDIRSHVFIVIGLPGEQDCHREETAHMLFHSGFDWAHIFLAVPIPGSRLYDLCVEEGYIDTRVAEHYVVTRSVIRAPGVDPDLLEKYAYELQLRVNFLHNANLLQGRIDVATAYFQNVVNRYPDHAWGHHFLAACHRAAGREGQAREHEGHFTRLRDQDPFWRTISERHGVHAGEGALPPPGSR